jgi:hypothetical protein
MLCINDTGPRGDGHETPTPSSLPPFQRARIRLAGVSMQQERASIDIGHDAEIVRIAEDVARSGHSSVLTQNGEVLAVLSPLPVSVPTATEPQPAPSESPTAWLEALIGIGEGRDVTDVSSKIHRYVEHTIAGRFLAQLRTVPSENLVRVTQDDALALIAQYADQNFSRTDATRFVVMERLRIRHAFSFDDDFRQFGGTVLTST